MSESFSTSTGTHATSERFPEPFRTILDTFTPEVPPAATIDELRNGAPIADEAPVVHEPTTRDLMFIAFWSVDHVRRMEAILALGFMLGVDRAGGLDAIRKPDPESPAEVRVNAIIDAAARSEFQRLVLGSAGGNNCETDV